ncbi:uncharacterized protein LOC18440905 isoform X3 [Amborella trichopoda]|uniref:uncharacterized protein LOC18440905 isoform X3 n=1 Tax=Amborella trichopoda TaxID=13333 RepID=UPI0005D41F93|nr:uncharacterized protein LOC18440905 isoform X3 [Amborella trichopoda]|eukprot:XP_011625813.1 uncharacterized protein LOC18440905 isoform X3 [Amborella trichopoda]
MAAKSDCTNTTIKRKKVMPETPTSSKKISKWSNVTRRHSQRLQKPVFPNSNDAGTEPVIEDIEVSDSDDDSSKAFHEADTRFVASEEQMEEKTDTLVSLLEDKEKIIEELLSDQLCMPFSSESMTSVEVQKLMEKKNKFKSLYINCHRKFDKGFDKGSQQVFAEAFEKFKNEILASTSKKIIETDRHGSSLSPVSMLESATLSLVDNIASGNTTKPESMSKRPARGSRMK